MRLRLISTTRHTSCEREQAGRLRPLSSCAPMAARDTNNEHESRGSGKVEPHRRTAAAERPPS